MSAISFHNRGAAKQAIDLHDDAIKDFDRAIYLEQDKSLLYHYYNNRAWSKYEIGKYKEGLKDVDISINLNSKYSNSFFTRSLIKYKIGDYEHACDDMKKSILLGGTFSKEWLEEQGKGCG